MIMFTASTTKREDSLYLARIALYARRQKLDHLICCKLVAFDCNRSPLAVDSNDRIF